VGPINLQNYGSGEIFISLSKRKLAANGKIVNPSAEKDAEVAADFACVLSAGLVAERLAEELEQGIRANPECARPDHEYVRKHLKAAGLSTEFAQYEEKTRQLLQSEWDLLRDLAAILFEKVALDPTDIVEFIEQHVVPNAKT